MKNSVNMSSSTDTRTYVMMRLTPSMWSLSSLCQVDIVFHYLTALLAVFPLSRGRLYVTAKKHASCAFVIGSLLQQLWLATYRLVCLQPSRLFCKPAHEGAQYSLLRRVSGSPHFVVWLTLVCPNMWCEIHCSVYVWFIFNQLPASIAVR